MRQQSLSRKIVLAYSLLVTLAAGLLTSGLYWQLRTVQRQAIADRLLELLRLSAPQIDSDYLALTVTADSMKEPFYKINQKRLQNIQAAVPSIDHIYTLRQQPNGQFVFVLDYASSNRSSAPVGKPLQRMTPRLKAGIASLKQPIVEPDLLSNPAGLPVLYGYAPIKNQFGRTNGVLVIELNASSIIQSELQAGAIAARIFCLVLLLTLVVIWWLSQSLVIHPILQLNQASKQIASGQWEQPLPSDRTDELGDLAASFNQMAQQLREAFATLEQRVQERTYQLQLAFSAAKMGNWEWDMLTGRQYWSAENYGLWGFCTDPSGRVLDQAGVEISPFPTFELVLSRVHSDDRACLLQTVQQTAAQHQLYEIEHRILWDDGSVHWHYSRGTYVFNQQGHPIKLVAISMDVTDRKQVEAEIRRSKDLFEVMFEESADAIFLVDVTTRLNVTCNHRAVELHEANDRDELIGVHSPTTLTKTPFTTAELTAVRSALTTQGFWNSEVEYITRKGNTFWGSVACKQILVAGEPMVLVRVTDISDRKHTEAERQQAETASRQSEARFLHLAANIPGIFYQSLIRADGSRQFHYVSSGLQRLFELEPAQLIEDANLFWTLVHPDDIEPLRVEVTRTLITHEPFQFEYRIISPSGQIKWIHNAASRRYLETGDVVSDGVVLDISDRKQAEFRMQRQAEADQLLAVIAQTINQSVRLDEVLEICLEQIRQFLQSDRVLVCRFDAAYDVVIDLEAVSQPELSLLGQTIHDPCFGKNWAEQYRQGYITVRPDTHTEDIAPCYAEFLAQIQVRASLVVAILQADQIWGLLVVHHCHAPRQWQAFEIDLLKQLGLQIGTAGQKASLYTQLETELAERRRAEQALAQQVQRERLLRNLSQQIRQSLRLDEILATTVTEVRQLLNADRALIFQLSSDRSGVVIKESVCPDYPTTEGMHFQDEQFPLDCYEFYRQGQVRAISNITTDLWADCLMEFMQQVGVKSKIVASILQVGEDNSVTVWGVLIVHACADYRQWQPIEVDLLQQLATQVGIAIQQANLYQKLENQLGQKEVLLKEVHHRVKNNLQVISSMLWLQAKATEHATVFHALVDTRSRLQAMALIHETLYESTDLGRLKFHDYIQRLATNILAANSTHSHQISLVYRLQPTLLNLETAIPCGLLLNELVTNAVKHAFPNQQTGQVYITLQQTLSPSPEPFPSLASEGVAPNQSSERQLASYILTVQDDGVGIPESLGLQSLKSLGLKIAYDLALQLRGTLELDRTNGTRFQLTFSALEYRKRF